MIIVQNLIELHGGRLELTSELRKGTDAKVILPASRVMHATTPDERGAAATTSEAREVPPERPKRPARLRTGEEMVLRFRVRDSTDAPVVLEPYLGMPGHAMIARDDGEVFVHLHALGTVSTAAIAVLEAIERGDTLPSRRPYAPRPRLDAVTAHDGMVRHTAGERDATLEFPFAFPRPGHHGIWVQVRVGGTIRTAAFTADVTGEQ